METNGPVYALNLFDIVDGKNTLPIQSVRHARWRPTEGNWWH